MILLVYYRRFGFMALLGLMILTTVTGVRLVLSRWI